MRWFHGDREARASFADQVWDRDRTVASQNANGPGIYFTSSQKEAASYGPFLYEGICLPGFRLMPKKKPTMRFLLAIFSHANAADREIFLSNWDTKDPRRALASYAQREPTIHDAAQVLYGDLIRSAGDWIRAMVACGYDGVVVSGESLANGVQHLVVFDPSKMRVSRIVAE